MRKIKCWNYVKAVVVFITAGLLVYACKRDYDATEFERPKGNKELSPSVARQWFERNYSPIVELRLGNRPSGGLDLRSSSDNTNSKVSESGILIKPNWEKTTEGRKKDIEVVEISAMTNNRLFFMDEETRDRRSPSDGKSMRNTARVVIHKDLKTGETRSFLMVFVGTYDYLKSGNNIAKNSYFKRDPNFEGDVMFYNLDGSLINGWRYRNKKIVARITPTHLSSNALNKRMQAGNTKKAMSGNARMSGGYEECTDIPIFIEREICEQEGYESWDEELGAGAGVNMICRTEVSTDYERVCNWVEDPWTPPALPPNPPDESNPGYVDPNPSSPSYDFEIIDSLHEYPCVQQIIKQLEKFQSFKSLTDPFRQNNISGSPTLTWGHTTSQMNWGSGTYSYGYTKTSSSVYDRDVEIYLNTEALNNTSELMVASTIIHESIHAYTSYYLKSLRNEYLEETGETISKFWLSSTLELINLTDQYDSNANYRDHLAMLSGGDIFVMMFNILKAWGGNEYTDDEYLMASMNGLNNAGQLMGQDVTTAQKNEVEQTFNNLLNALNITKSQFNAFINEQNSKQPGQGKLPCAK